MHSAWSSRVQSRWSRWCTTVSSHSRVSYHCGPNSFGLALSLTSKPCSRWHVSNQNAWRLPHTSYHNIISWIVWSTFSRVPGSWSSICTLCDTICNGRWLHFRRSADGNCGLVVQHYSQIEVCGCQYSWFLQVLMQLPESWSCVAVCTCVNGSSSQWRWTNQLYVHCMKCCVWLLYMISSKYVPVSIKPSHLSTTFEHLVKLTPFSPTLFWLWQRRVYKSIQRHTDLTYSY